ncbi:MAG: hypothetical protein A3G33_02905 [Omnitrophica bacterium RIFCSPLOWO2_12_FULL_44_17]|uniref:PDZ domain-containing protein n=1 Tax=Candidatus Danuiimicrobium aquiferis TaxID=1801832 RepID=A0A1G1KVF4_9BACT|nr:MAG: hypothetical protein A3B72_04385 [Omnitrophica bacterium RIFCSPHIGHO2_02_FULL_45_28]OGW96928.1 MAG: hypothetical protein A3G33_02905 [Omnitrophica bacterium RIFCSPLOWO2_12_FULL_44_17]OGX03936.1 MAG: hypothetical protein A3J12_03510 [Omnitrophica bacterium RIFCSPLOWO2_02_FULL_44_11]
MKNRVEVIIIFLAFMIVTLVSDGMTAGSHDRNVNIPKKEEAKANIAQGEQDKAGEKQSSDTGSSRGKVDVMEELKLYSKALNAVLEGYVDDVEARQMLYEAVKGMMSSLDKYSNFIDAKTFEMMKIHMKGEYAGIGTILARLDGLPAIYEIQENSPAAKAGLLVKDKILQVDQTSTQGLEIEKVTLMMRGDAGTKVVLKIQRDEPKKIFDITLTREKIEIPAVKEIKMIGKHIGYVHISNWQENTIEQFDNAFNDLKAKGMQALIIDLRDNGGGLLTSAVDLAERFLNKDKIIVNVKSKVNVQRKEYISTGEKKLDDYELLVLINEKSASASEIFSAAMQDNKRGTVIGEKSYGKASVQSVIPLDDVTGMKLTTAKYFTPAGTAIDGNGVKPDIIVSKKMDGMKEDMQLMRAIAKLKQFM